MNEYEFTLKDKSRVKLSFSTNLDNLIYKYRNGDLVEGVFLMDCAIVQCMPYIMRYCFEEKVNLRSRKFIRELPKNDFDEIDRNRLLGDFNVPLRPERMVHSEKGNLVICSSRGSSFNKGQISIGSTDVPHFVEGIVRVLDYDGVRLAQIRSIQTIGYYHKCLDEALIK